VIEPSRIPPHDLPAEQAVLASILLERDALDQVTEHLRPDHFYSEPNRRIFEAALAVAQKSTPVDVVSVAGELRDRERLAQVGGSAYLAELVDAVPSVANVDNYARMVREKWRVRQLIATCQRLAAEGYGDVGEVQAFIDDAERSIYAIARCDERRDLARIDAVVRESYDRMCEAEKRCGEVELPTGLVALDKKIGGLGRGRLTVIAGRPGMGKTALAASVAEYLAAFAPVAFFSLEMPRWQIVTRMACGRAGVSAFKAIHGFTTPDEHGAILTADNELAALPMWIDDTPGLTLMQLRSKARRAAALAGGPLALIVVDYLQLMHGQAETRERVIADITSGCKRLAKELDCAIVLLSQLNRAVEKEKDRRPRLSDLRESGAIEQDADDVIFVYRDEVYDEQSVDKGIAELIVAKQRNGPTGTVRVGFNGVSTNFFNLSEAAS
jgi:replicative DNA helicase